MKVGDIIKFVGGPWDGVPYIHQGGMIEKEIGNWWLISTDGIQYCWPKDANHPFLNVEAELLNDLGYLMPECESIKVCLINPQFKKEPVFHNETL